MGKAGRFFCIFTPMALTIASLVCLIIVGLGGTNKSNATFNNLYFFRANTSRITVDPTDLSLPSNALTNAIVGGTTSAVKEAVGIYDFYHISLWNYCAGNFTSNAANSSTSDNVTYCSPHTNEFWFNPVEVWGLNNTGVDQFFSKELRDGLAAYQTTAKWMFIAYVVALISTIVEILVGFFALFSRWGSLATTIVSSVSSLFYIAFALTSTILYAVLTGTFNSALEKYDIHGSLGHSIYVTVWLGTAFTLGAGLFWMFSSCCCSGRSDRMKDYGNGRSARGPKYDRVGSPMPPPAPNGGFGYGQPAAQGYQVPSSHHMGPVGAQRQTSYEPFRHV